tara:strand:- start:24830 stop:25042 length:213 start_codon:yes stop_codon:yes gene_type:complete
MKMSVVFGMTVLLALILVPATYAGWLITTYLGDGWLSFAGGVGVFCLGAAIVLAILYWLALLGSTKRKLK